MSVPSRSPTNVSTEGRHALERGDPITANPYPEGSTEHRIWTRGYERVDREAEETLGEAAKDADGRISG
ncbi:Rmf/CrpP fold protein [Methylobacterium komagatae]